LQAFIRLFYCFSALILFVGWGKGMMYVKKYCSLVYKGFLQDSGTTG